MKNEKFFFRFCFAFLFLMISMENAWAFREPDLKDVSYGSDRLDTFDLWRPRSSSNSPAVIYFHGGRFTGGDKKDIPADFVNNLLDRGMVVISANYRLLNDGVFFPAPQLDAARLVQFVRSNSEQYKINPKQIAVSGMSAGGSLALWLALHSDMSKNDSSDPVERQSTRVCCAVAYSSPTSLDPGWISTHLRATKKIAKASKFFGVTPGEMSNPSPKLQQLMNEISPITHVTSDDPPLFLSYESEMTEYPLPPESEIEIAHHPAFGIFLQEKMRSVNLNIPVYWKSGGTKDNPMPRGADFDFLKNELKKAANR